MILNTNDGIQN